MFVVAAEVEAGQQRQDRAEGAGSGVVVIGKGVVGMPVGQPGAEGEKL